MTLAKLPDEQFTSAKIKRILLAEYDGQQLRCEERKTVKEALQTIKITEFGN